MALAVAADLRFELQRPGLDPVRGSVRGSASRLELDVDDPGALAGAGDAATLRVLAEGLAQQGVVLRVVHRGEHLVSLGAVNAPWWQRRFTGSRRVRAGSLRGAFTSFRARARGTEAVLPDLSLAPPPTLWPLVPTLRRRPRPRTTTTHDPARGGMPRLVLVRETAWPGERQPIYWLTDGFTIGSQAGCDLVLPGLEPVHARLVHDEDDEWTVVPVAGVTRVHGAPVVRQILRTGSRVEMGGHVLAFHREEYADHGRPYGGRIGGELGRQRPQPPREATPPPTP